MQTTLIEGDLIKTIRSRDELHEKVDAIVTSPPYNIGKKYGDGVAANDKRKPGDYIDWLDDCVRVMRLTMHEGSSLFLNIGATAKDPGLPMRVMDIATSHLKLQNVITWVKSIALPIGDGEHTFGHFKPINSSRFLNCTSELILHLTLTGEVPLNRKAHGVGTTYSDKSNIRRWKHTESGDMRCRGNVWFHPYETIQSGDKQRPHPATFPVSLAERCLRLHGVSGSSTVMDPFMGLGSTGRAAARAEAGRFVGIDVVADYVRLAGAAIAQEEAESIM